MFFVIFYDRKKNEKKIYFSGKYQNYFISCVENIGNYNRATCRRSICPFQQYFIHIRTMELRVVNESESRQKKKWEDTFHKDWTGMDFASPTSAAENMTR